MKLTNTTVECGWYEIMCSPEADIDRNSPEIIQSEPLRCEIDPKYLSRRNPTVPTNPALLEVFEAACLGTDSRWRLSVVHLNEKMQLVFGFTDLEAIGSKDVNSMSTRSGQYVEFKDFNGSFTVWANRTRCTIPDEYYFEFERTTAFDEKGECLIVDITEKRNGEYYSIDHISQRKDGKYYLTMHRYD